MIVTTAIKANAVHSLQDYMKIKGMYMRYRLDPTHANSTPGYYQEIAKFIEKHTDIPKNRFWYELDDDQKILFARFLHFSDDVPNQFNIRSDDRQAQVCVVLNGNADVLTRITTPNPEDPNIETKDSYSQGKCFGSFDEFDRTYDMLVNQEILALNSPGKNFRLKEKEKKAKADWLEANGGREPDEKIPIMMTVLMQSGTWLHIGIRDYREYVLKIVPEPKDMEEETDEQISGIPKDQMTVEDFKCVAVKRAAKRRLAETMFNFMAKYELIPHNAAVLSSEFVQKGSMGRSILLNKEFVYVIIDGRTCMEVHLISSAAASDSGTGTEAMGGKKLHQSQATHTHNGRSGASATNGTKRDRSSTGTTTSGINVGGVLTVGMERGPDPDDPWSLYKDAPTISVKRRDMPIILLEAGTIINIHSSHYNVGHGGSSGGTQGHGHADGGNHDGDSVAPESSGFLPHIGVGSSSVLPEGSSLETGRVSERRGSVTHSPRHISKAPLTSHSHSHSLISSSNAVDTHTHVPTYEIRLTHETAVTYLCIPRKTFMSALKEVDAITARDVLEQLAAGQDLVSTRLIPLAPWIRGSMRIITHNPANPMPKVTLTAAEEAAKKKLDIKLNRSGTGRGILGVRKKPPFHIRDTPLPNPLEVNEPSMMVVHEKCEGSFMTTDDLRALVTEREKEIEKVKKENAIKALRKDREERKNREKESVVAGNTSISPAAASAVK